MRTIRDISALEALYDAPVPSPLTKAATKITPLYRQWIEAARFCVLPTVGRDGTDGAPARPARCPPPVSSSARGTRPSMRTATTPAIPVTP